MTRVTIRFELDPNAWLVYDLAFDQPHTTYDEEGPEGVSVHGWKAFYMPQRLTDCSSMSPSPIRTLERRDLGRV